jgi:hypothetical protein
LRQALSKIYINFNLWTSPNGTLALYVIMIYYLNHTLQAKFLLLDLKKIESNYLGENLAACYLSIIKDFKLEGKIGYFMSDNVGSNDLAVNKFYRYLKLKNLITRRLRYLRHVINLAAKAFLFNKK